MLFLEGQVQGLIQLCAALTALLPSGNAAALAMLGRVLVEQNPSRPEASESAYASGFASVRQMLEQVLLTKAHAELAREKGNQALS